MPHSRSVLALVLLLSTSLSAHAALDNRKQAAVDLRSPDLAPEVADKQGTPNRRRPPAEAQPSAPHWSGGGEMGFASARGNSNTESLNGKVDFQYAQGLWNHSASLAALHSSSLYKNTDDNGVMHSEMRTTANRYTIALDSAYSMDERGTLNTSLRAERDEFGSYSEQQSLSFSYGNRIVDADRVKLDLQFGPGYRHAYDAVQERQENSLIGRGFANFRYSITDNAELVNKLLVESGKYNTFAQNDLGVSVTMNSHLALKAGWQARHNSDTVNERVNTDTLTTMNVVYRFR